MRTLDIVNRAARSLRNAKTRTILTSLAIAVGAFTITISLAAGEGTRQYADTLINSNVNPQALFIVKDPSITEGPASQSPLRVYDENVGSTPTGLALEQMTQEDVDKLLERDDLTNVVPTYQPTVDYVQFEGSDTKFTADVSYYNTTIVTGLSKGGLPAQGTDLADGDIVVPGSYVETLVENDVIANADELIGKQITVTASQAT
ncbi:hypothetical protein B7Z17_01815, partial [Candidatus Saccharibacteria bacterium 32-49-10]